MKQIGLITSGGGAKDEVGVGHTTIQQISLCSVLLDQPIRRSPVRWEGGWGQASVFRAFSLAFERGVVSLLEMSLVVGRHSLCAPRPLLRPACLPPPTPTPPPSSPPSTSTSPGLPEYLDTFKADLRSVSIHDYPTTNCHIKLNPQPQATIPRLSSRLASWGQAAIYRFECVRACVRAPIAHPRLRLRWRLLR